MSEMRFPLQGTKCVDCGCCQANVYAGNDPLCWACDAGSHGPKKVPQAAPTSAVKTSPVREESQTREVIHTPVAPTVKSVPVVEKPNPAEATPLQTEEAMPSHHSRVRVSDAVRAAVIAADPSISNQVLADKHGISYNSVWLIRKGVGIKPVRAAGGGKVKKVAAKRTPKSAPASAIVAAIDRIVVPSGRVVTIQGEITPAGADAFWNILSLDQKAHIIQASLRSILQPKEA